MTAITWKPNANGYWAMATNWSGGVVPGTADTVTLTTASVHTIYFNTTDTITSLTSTNDLLAIQGGPLGVSGNLSLAGGLTETGGTLNLLGTTDTIAGPVTLTSGDVGIGPTTTLTLSGQTSLGSTSSTYGAHIHGAGTLVATGVTSIADYGGTAEAVLGGGLTWKNTGTVNQAGIVTAYYTGSPALAIVNAAGARYNLTSDDASITNNTIINAYGGTTPTGSTFVNAGTLAKTSGLGKSSIASVLTNTGTIASATGILEFDGGGTIGGTITGAGTVALGGGTFALASTVSVQAGTFLIDGATVELGGNLAPMGGVALTSGAVELDGFTLALASPQLVGGEIDGPGTVTTKGTTATGNFSVGGGADWINNGTVDQSGNGWDTIADSTGAGTITNAAGASWDIIDDSGLYFYNSQSLTGNFVNLGTFAKTGGTNISHILASFVSTGVVSVAAGGTLEFDNVATLGGTISGAGTLSISTWNDSGNVTLAAGTTLTVANLDLGGGVLTLASAEAYGGAFSMTYGSLELNGNNFSVANAFLNGTVEGLGTFTTSGTTTVQNLYLGGGGQLAQYRHGQPGL